MPDAESGKLLPDSADSSLPEGSSQIPQLSSEESFADLLVKMLPIAAVFNVGG